MNIQYFVYANGKLVHQTKHQVEARRVAGTNLLRKETKTLKLVALFQGIEKVLLNVVNA